MGEDMSMISAERSHLLSLADRKSRVTVQAIFVPASR
jgi:hypothetical protein